ncbi:MAG: cysteine synthase family protein [Candidatus Delongbacteria bacterium]|nr:cysteine synthase family protein [Candidatus Delongbacteria bacterium]MBN2835781.1 cysteine synthase family protein [Candidatus Delongbacteria bacterium]
MRYYSILEMIGNTPHLKLGKLFRNNEVWVKIEKNNPGGSIKDRIALNMIIEAEKKGILKKGMHIIESTSGNTGIGLVLVGRQLGYDVTIVMPESSSIERRKIIERLGGNLILTPAQSGMKGSLDKTSEILEKGGFFNPAQFSNEVNPDTHYFYTAEEIISDFPDGLDYFVAGVGTGGHISGVGKRLKEVFPDMKIIAVEPAGSAMLSSGKSGSHKIQGIGAGFIPDNFNSSIVDEIIVVSEDAALNMSEHLALQEGVLAGFSSGAVISVIKSIDERVNNKIIMGFIYDSYERYFSSL